jgi:hypothetical protein
MYMHRMRITAACLVAAVAVGAATAASASALPEFTGPFPKTFTSTSKASLFETVSGTKTKCTADTNTGEITGPQSGEIQITFTGCKLGKIPCNTPGATPGTIVTSMLSMRIGYINKAKKIVGADLVEPTTGFLTYGCGSATFVKVQGSVIGRLLPINKLVTPSEVFRLIFVQSLGNQKFPNLEASPIDILESSFGGPFEVTGLASVDKILFGEPVTLLA